MKSLISYHLHDYVRSQKYFPPVAAYFVCILVFYTYKPNPVIDSYAVTALMLYVIAAWLAISVLSLDSPVQRHIMILQVNSTYRYYFSKLLTVWIIALLLALFAFVLPIIFDMFSEPVTFTTGVVSFIHHVLLFTLGIGVGSLFSKPIVEGAVNAYGGLALTITVSIAALGIYEALPPLWQNITWLIPPAVNTQEILRNWSGESISHLPLFPFIWMMMYAVILHCIFFRMVKK